MAPIYIRNIACFFCSYTQHKILSIFYTLSTFFSSHFSNNIYIRKSHHEKIMFIFFHDDFLLCADICIQCVTYHYHTHHTHQTSENVKSNTTSIAVQLLHSIHLPISLHCPSAHYLMPQNLELYPLKKLLFLGIASKLFSIVREYYESVMVMLLYQNSSTDRGETLFAPTLLLGMLYQYHASHTYYAPYDDQSYRSEEH